MIANEGRVKVASCSSLWISPRPSPPLRRRVPTAAPMGEIEGTYRRVDPAEAARGKPTPVRATRSDESAAETHGNLLPITVRLLDDTEKIFDVPPKAEGIALLTTVYKHLNLVESDYFGLELEPYPKCGFTVWLDSQKPIAKQVKKPKNVVFKLGVKFFPEDSSQLQEEITRYQFALQVRQDLLAGRLVASEMSSSLMAACLLQADVSDYEEQRSSQQLREVQYLPNQEVLANRILDYHRQFAGLSPAEADVQLLEIARRQDTYGLRLHQAYDKEGASINLAVGYSGVSVFQNTTKINTFNWAKIRKLSFKRKYFLVKFHPDIEGNYQDTLEFSMKGRDACKAFWKGCVESHAFFRLQDPPRPKPKSVLFSRGSSFRYRQGLGHAFHFPFFNDMLVYTSKALTTNNQFKVHGKMQLSTLKITASEREFSIPCSFTLSTPQKHVVVAANSPEEMDKWVEDVTLAARRAADDTVDHATAGHSPCRETDIVESHICESHATTAPDGAHTSEDSAEDEAASPRSPHGASSERLSVHQQTSSTVQVCCHRQTSVSLLDISRAAENQLSGYLLRKFKNNSGWQKLWVVFTNFCLFFYKTHQDNFPLASLPVLGYSITLPSESDGILKDYVFKLQFKSHIYFFRAESEYTFERWMEVIRSATSSSARTRLLSRKDSHFT
ncbi:unnamed protein product [Lampetra fluviatilis]